MKPSDQNHLLREILAEDSTETLRTSSLARGLHALRRRRLRRTLISSLAATTLLAAILTVVAQQRPRIGSSDPSVTLSSRAPRFEIIDDQQLLALFPDRSTALIGAPGNQTLLFLDSSSAVTPIARK